MRQTVVLIAGSPVTLCDTGLSAKVGTTATDAYAENPHWIQNCMEQPSSQSIYLLVENNRLSTGQFDPLPLVLNIIAAWELTFTVDRSPITLTPSAGILLHNMRLQVS